MVEDRRGLPACKLGYCTVRLGAETWREDSSWALSRQVASSNSVRKDLQPGQQSSVKGGRIRNMDGLSSANGTNVRCRIGPRTNHGARRVLSARVMVFQAVPVGLHLFILTSFCFPFTPVCPTRLGLPLRRGRSVAAKGVESQKPSISGLTSLATAARDQ